MDIFYNTIYLFLLQLELLFFTNPYHLGSSFMVTEPVDLIQRKMCTTCHTSSNLFFKN